MGENTGFAGAIGAPVVDVPAFSADIREGAVPRLYIEQLEDCADKIPVVAALLS